MRKQCPRCNEILRDVIELRGVLYCIKCPYCQCPLCNNEMIELDQRVCGHATYRQLKCNNCGHETELEC